MKYQTAFLFLVILTTGCENPSRYESSSPNTNGDLPLGIEVIPARISLRKDDVSELIVVLINPDGSKIRADSEQTVFIPDNNSISISDNGIVRGDIPGDGTITVQHGGFETSIPFQVTARPDYRMLVISEVMYSPSENERELEYIEIYNRSDQSCSLDGVSLSDSGNSCKPFRLDGFAISPHSYMIIGRSDQAFLDMYGCAADAFPFSFDLSNSGDAVFLIDPDGGRIDSLYIRNGGSIEIPPEWGTLISSAKGKSLSRSDPMIDTDSSSDFTGSDPSPGY